MKTILCLALMSALMFGCSASEKARLRAADLERELEVYENDQQSRIDKINDAYRDSYGHLVQAFRDTTDEQRHLLFRADAQQFADALMDDPGSATLPSRVRQALAAANAAQLQRVRAHDEALATQERVYGESYSNLAASLAQIRAARGSLKEIAEDRNLNKQYAELGKLLVQFARQVEQAWKEQQDEQP